MQRIEPDRFANKLFVRTSTSTESIDASLSLHRKNKKSKKYKKHSTKHKHPRHRN
jgi:hypothetical protein